MPKALEEITKDAMDLPPRQRLALAELLLESADAAADSLSYGLRGALLTALHGDNLLPVASPGALSEFAMVPGRWRELPPGN